MLNPTMGYSSRLACIKLLHTIPGSRAPSNGSETLLRIIRGNSFTILSTQPNHSELRLPFSCVAREAKCQLKDIVRTASQGTRLSFHLAPLVGSRTTTMCKAWARKQSIAVPAVRICHAAFSAILWTGPSDMEFACAGSRSEVSSFRGLKCTTLVSGGAWLSIRR